MTEERAVVLDASAILAVLYGEPGEEEIREWMRASRVVVGTVNLAEVAGKLAEGGLDEKEIREAVDVLSLEVLPLDADAAYGAGMLKVGTRERGMGVGDLSCVAVARGIGGVALTTDGIWSGLDGVEVVRR